MESGIIVTTQNCKINLFLNLYIGEKILTLICFLLPLKREVKKSLTLAAYVLSLGTLAFLPVTLSEGSKEGREEGRI